MITAIVLIHVTADRIQQTAQAIADIEGVNEVYSCAGDVDLIALVRVGQHEKLADVITSKVNAVPGVQRTATHIAFRSYSRRDTEASFAIGMDDPAKP